MELGYDKGCTNMYHVLCGSCAGNETFSYFAIFFIAEWELLLSCVIELVI